MDEWGFLKKRRYLIYDRDTKFTDPLRAIVKSSYVVPLKLPAWNPNLNAHAERWVKSVKDECLSKLILFGVSALRRALREYVTYYHEERNHQGKGNILLFPTAKKAGNHDWRIYRLQGTVRWDAEILPSRGCMRFLILVALLHMKSRSTQEARVR